MKKRERETTDSLSLSLQRHLKQDKATFKEPH